MDHTLTLSAADLTSASGASDVSGPGDGDGSVLFIGNATVLLRFRGFTILTDPTFVHRHEQVPLGYGMHATRLTDPALDIPDLPSLDFVLLSHFHGDHFDQVAERDLDPNLLIITTMQAQDQLAERGFTNTIGLETWDTVTLTKGTHELRIVSCPGRHGPGIAELAMPDVMGSVLEFTNPSGVDTRRVYITGDTLVFEDLYEIPNRYPDLDVGLFHLGGTKVMGILVTMDADQGVQAVRMIAPKVVIPVHYDDYDVFTSGLEDFLRAADQAGIRDRIHPLRRGESYRLT